MGLLKKLFSIPAKFARVFTFYNKNGIVTRILTLLGAIAFTVATIFLEKWAFGLFADNYFWGLLALIFSFSIGLGCAEFLIMCCITAILSTLKSSVVDTAKFISKKSKEKKEKNSDKKDSGSESELNSEGLSELRAAEQNIKKSSKDTGFGFKDAVNPEEWKNITNTLQQAEATNNLENISLVQTVLDSKQVVETESSPTQNLGVQNQPETAISNEGEQVVEVGQSDENTAQIQPVNAGLNEKTNNEVVVNLQQNVEVQPQSLPVESLNQTELTENVVPITQTENIETTAMVENTTEVLQTEESITQEQPAQTLTTQEPTTQELTTEEQTTATENGEEETKTNLETESQKLENMLQNENEKAEELEKKAKKSYKIFDIFCALIIAFLGFVVVTQYIAIFKENAEVLKFWEKIDFSVLWKWMKFW